MHNRRHFKLGPTEWRSRRDPLVSRFQLNHFHFHFNLGLIGLPEVAHARLKMHKAFTSEACNGCVVFNSTFQGDFPEISENLQCFPFLAHNCFPVKWRAHCWLAILTPSYSLIVIILNLMLKHYHWRVHLPIVKNDFTAILQNLHALHTFHFL